MKKQTIKLSESQLRNIIKSVLKENMDTTRELVNSGKYNGYSYGIVQIKHPVYRMYSEEPVRVDKWLCAYVVIPEGHPLYGKDYVDINQEFMNIGIEITYSDCHPLFGNQWCIGWSYNHDYEYETSIEEVMEDVKRVIDNINQEEQIGNSQPLNESKLRKIIRESFKTILNEGDWAEDTLAWQEWRDGEESELNYPKIFRKEITSKMLRQAILKYYSSPKVINRSQSLKEFLADNGITDFTDRQSIIRKLTPIVYRAVHNNYSVQVVKMERYGNPEVDGMGQDLENALQTLSCEIPKIFDVATLKKIVNHVVSTISW